MNKKTLFLLLLICTSIKLEAKTNIVYMGGGGEGNKNDTIFDSNIKEMKSVLENKQWDYTVSFNGGHKKTESLLKSSFPKSPLKPFSEASYLEMLAQIKVKLNSNQIKKGEQILLFIDTHGAGRIDEKTHSVSITDNKSVTNYDNLKGNGLVSLDKIQEIIKLSEAKGVKLGIIDLSCHSGNTLDLSYDKSKTCIVTSTGPNHYAFAGRFSFGNEFIKQLANSPHTLETAYLEARRLSNDNGYPMISTPQAELARRSIYELITPYFQYQSTNVGKLKSDLIELSSKCYDCENASLNELIKKLEKFKSIGIISHKETSTLIAKLLEYEKLRRELAAEYKKLQLPGITNKETFRSLEINPSTKKPYYELSFSWSELAQTNEYKLDKMIRLLLNNAVKSNYKDYDNYKKATLSLKGSILKRKQEILKANPKLLSVEQDFDKILKKSKNTFNLANDISKLERRIYNDLYFNNTFDKTNACATIAI